MELCQKGTGPIVPTETRDPNLNIKTAWAVGPLEDHTNLSRLGGIGWW